MTAELGINPSLVLQRPISSDEYLEQLVGALRDIVARALGVGGFEESLMYMQKLYSPAMLGTCCASGEKLKLKPFICALYMINVVSKIRMKQSSWLSRIFSSEKRELFDAHAYMLQVSERTLEKNDNWDAGIYGVFFTGVLRTLQLGEPAIPPPY